MKNKYLIAIMIALLAWFITLSVVSAQDELTLEDLAEGLNAALQSIGLLAERVTTIEKRFEGPGAIVLEENRCVLGLDDHLQDSTVIKFKDQYDEWLDVDDVSVVAVQYSLELDHVSIIYEEWYSDRFVIEEWSKCEFIGSSDWWEED